MKSFKEFLNESIEATVSIRASKGTYSSADIKSDTISSSKGTIAETSFGGKSPFAKFSGLTNVSVSAEKGSYGVTVVIKPHDVITGTEVIMKHNGKEILSFYAD